MAPVFEAFCASVCRHVTYGPAHASITAELASHMEDHAAHLAQRGLPQAEAERRAVAAMGDPEALGRALNRAHPVLLNLAEAAARWASCVLILLLLLLFVMGLAGLAARAADPDAAVPVCGAVSARPNRHRIVGTRARVGHTLITVSDCWIYRDEAGAYAFHARWNAVSLNPFLTNGFDGLRDQITLLDDLGHTWPGDSRCGVALSGLAPDAAELTVRFDLCGNTCTLRIPLDWGDLRDAPL